MKACWRKISPYTLIFHYGAPEGKKKHLVNFGTLNELIFKNPIPYYGTLRGFQNSKQSLISLSYYQKLELLKNSRFFKTLR